jgi:hypothetical protein
MRANLREAANQPVFDQPSVIERIANGVENKIVAFPRSWKGYNAIGDFLRKIG